MTCGGEKDRIKGRTLSHLYSPVQGSRLPSGRAASGPAEEITVAEYSLELQLNVFNAKQLLNTYRSRK